MTDKIGGVLKKLSTLDEHMPSQDSESNEDDQDLSFETTVVDATSKKE